MNQTLTPAGPIYTSKGLINIIIVSIILQRVGADPGELNNSLAKLGALGVAHVSAVIIGSKFKSV